MYYVCSANEQALSLLCASVGGPSKTYEPMPPVQSRHEQKLHGGAGRLETCFALFYRAHWYVFQSTVNKIVKTEQ